MTASQQLPYRRPGCRHVSHRIRIPTLGEHGNRHHAADRAPKRPGFPTVFMTSRSNSWSAIFSPAQVAGSLDIAKTLYLIGGYRTKVVIQGVARLELLAVDEEGVRPRKRVSSCSSKLRNRARRPFSSVEVPSSFFRWKPEMKSYTSLEMAVFWQTMMKQRRHADALLLPKSERFLVVTIKSLHGREAGSVTSGVSGLRLGLGPSSACPSECSPRDSDRRASRRRGCSRRREHAGSLTMPALNGIH